ncbi:MAG: endodeoxyribonuclease [Methylophilales bacterium 28-44-11]|nr:MAG: endodeoxyribonuclease [Methylophilales bacterium 28-44-11]
MKTTSKNRHWSSAVRQRAIAEGYRSGLEEVTADYLTSKGVGFKYEELVIGYTEPVKTRKYTPDFELPNGIIIETKGRFLTSDRQKHLLIKKQYPHLDIRFVFSNSKARLSKISKTTYGMWCEKNGFKFADKVIPEEWLKEVRETTKGN